ncbi:MAG: hypothetical protein ABIT64_01655, partial [Lysobacteraceae bacterium]
YRESLAEERVLKLLADAGAAPDALAALVNRRLLRIEERLDMRRVELTHDVLCSVVLASRNLRHEREARDEAEHQLATQREREAATHRALLRARMIASVCSVLMVVAVAGAIFGWISQRRARVAEAEAQSSRSNAEKLVSFLIEDFYTELAPTGRLDTLGKLAHMTVGYYDGLPPELVTKQTKINRAMAMLREGSAHADSGDIAGAYKLYTEGQAVFEKLRAAGERDEETTYGLALALYYQGNSVVGGGQGRGTAKQLNEAANLLRPLAYAPGASRRVRQLYAANLDYLSHTQPLEQGVATCDEGRKMLVGLGALDLSNLEAASEYADTADSEARHLTALGRIEQAQQLEQQVYEIAEKVLARRPGDLHAMQDRAWAAGLSSLLAARRHDDAGAAEYARRAVAAGEDEVRFNSSDLGAWWRWTLGLQFIAKAQFDHGDIAQAIATQRSLLALKHDKRLPSSLGPVVWYQWIELAKLQAQTGDAAGAAQSFKSYVHDVGEYLAGMSANDPRRALLAEGPKTLDASLRFAAGDLSGALAAATDATDHVAAVKYSSDDVNSKRTQFNLLGEGLSIASHAAIDIGRPAQAEALARRWLAVSPDLTNSEPEVDKARARVTLAHAIAAQGRLDEARTTLQPALDWYRKEQQAGAHETGFRRDFAYALYVDAIAQATDGAGASQRSTDLKDAAAQIDGASEEAKRLVDMRRVSVLIAAAQAH